MTKRGRRVPKKRVSFYKIKWDPAFKNDVGIEVQGYHFDKYAAVRDESFEKESSYFITKYRDTNVLSCNCPAYKTPCRHIKMTQYAMVMGMPQADSFMYWESDEKEPEIMSIDDILETWNLPDPRESKQAAADEVNFDE